MEKLKKELSRLDSFQLDLIATMIDDLKLEKSFVTIPKSTKSKQDSSPQKTPKKSKLKENSQQLDTNDYLPKWRELATEFNLPVPKKETKSQYKKLFSQLSLLIVKRKGKLTHLKMDSKSKLKEKLHQLQHNKQTVRKSVIKDSPYGLFLVDLY